MLKPADTEKKEEVPLSDKPKEEDKNMDIFIPGNTHQRFYTNKGFPCMGVCALLLGIFMFGAAIGVLVIEKPHAAVSSVPFQSAPIVLLVAGIVSILAGGVEIFVTKWGEATRDRVYKGSFKFMLILILAGLITFVAAILGFVYVGKVENKMEDDMKVKLQEYGLTGRYESLTIINRIQSKNKCCGVINYVDWRNTTYGGHRYDKVPDSCCVNEKHACGFEFEIRKINRGGCLKVVRRSAVRHLLLVGVGGIIVSIIELALAVAVFVIRKKYFSH